MTIGENLAAIQKELALVSDSAQLEAEMLLLSVLGREEPSWLYAHSEEQLSPEKIEQLRHLCQRRHTGEPLAYLLGQWNFYGRSFYITPDVLIPRPSTEKLVARTIKYLDKQKEPQMIAEIGTGSGCVAISLLLERPEKIKWLIATDISSRALKIAQKNAAWHGVSAKIKFSKEDLEKTLLRSELNLLVSNPPYVPSGELKRAEQHRETKGLIFEPEIALDGGPQGNSYTKLIAQSSLPHIFETRGGKIETGNLSAPTLSPKR